MSTTLADWCDPFPEHLGTREHVQQQYADLTEWGPGWWLRPPDKLLRELMDKLGKSEVDDGLQRVFGAQLRVCAELTGVALLYNSPSRRPERTSFEPGAFARADEMVRAGLVELRCEHQTRLSHLIGRVVSLSDEQTDHGLALVFTAEVFGSPESRDVVRQVETRLRLGELIGVSVGPSGTADTVLRSDGFKHVLATGMREISLTDKPAMVHARVTSLRWRGKPAVYEADGLWRQRKRMVAESRGLIRHRDCASMGNACTFDKRGGTTLPNSAKSLDPQKEAEKARIRAHLPIAYRNIWSASFMDEYLDQLVGSGR